MTTVSDATELTRLDHFDSGLIFNHFYLYDIFTSSVIIKYVFSCCLIDEINMVKQRQ